MEDIELKSSSQEIDVLIVIDTDYVRSTYPNPSKDPNNPTGIDHNSQHMIVSNANAISGQGTADLNFSARAGDIVSFRGTSIYQNSDDAVIIYNIKYWSGDQVFNSFMYNSVERRQAAVPNLNSQNGLPAASADITFASIDSKVKATGTENFYVQFGLYILDPNDSNKQILYGYFYWDPTITVK
ncbi:MULTISPECIES: inclusion body family protein [Chryseobacterium]|uniref:inclusion body family protein n=1 Tax=Chryseobacterium TaxID=59732 RepID=UPI000D7183AB|nr:MULTISPECIES: inclusion body family protein [Chryseobacterium]MDQ1857496.1 inclusion body family protein [Chryseobacterium sp. WLY505]PWW29851.1 inclusion body protein [Chryseobacterium sp. AG844]QRA43857.1 inclusion body family protein [Chryseobacterium cucumeris]